MTIYFDKRAFQQKEEEIQLSEEEAEIKKQREEGAAAIVAVFSFFGKPLIIMLLWNWLLPGIFGLATIGYLKSLGLFVLARIIIDKE
tara:strand:- start:182 stop:442 length:261 start_codon:yes stop_codon:yes gene_type:complete